MSDKVIGYILVSLGVALITFGLFSVYTVFTGRAKPIDVFNLPGISLDFASMLGSELPEEQKQDLTAQDAMKTDLLSSDMINQPLNLTFHLLFMGFVVNVGYKLALIGASLVRPIKVKLKGKIEQEVENVKA